MGVDAQILFGKVMHGRLFPKRNHFTYGIYYLSLSLADLNNAPIAHNRFAALSFHDRDHGACDGSNLQKWATNILTDYGLEHCSDITLICMPRVFGYVFNPVSFWLCRDENGILRAILSEVHNTFGERHTYLCAHDDHREITANDTMQAEKIFHVSPMLKREGHYEFRFDIREDHFGIGIDFYDGEGNKQLITTLNATPKPLSRQALRKAFWRYPLVTFKAIILIHWQALKILAKGIPYISKPQQKQERVSTTSNLTKK